MVGGPAPRTRRRTRKLQASRRAAIERLEERTVLSGGIVLTSIGATTMERAFASFLDSSGKIVVAGDSYLSGQSTTQKSAVVRYQADGTLDSNFGAEGVVTTEFPSSINWTTAAVAYPGGQILTAGVVDLEGYHVSSCPADFALARYNADGSLDSTFGQSGTVRTDLGGRDTIDAVVVLPDDTNNRIVAVGFSVVGASNPYVLAGYTSSGQLDPYFGSGGIVRGAFGNAGQARPGLHRHQRHPDDPGEHQNRHDHRSPAVPSAPSSVTRARALAPQPAARTSVPKLTAPRSVASPNPNDQALDRALAELAGRDLKTDLLLDDLALLRV